MHTIKSASFALAFGFTFLIAAQVHAQAPLELISPCGETIEPGKHVETFEAQSQTAYRIEFYVDGNLVCENIDTDGDDYFSCEGSYNWQAGASHTITVKAYNRGGNEVPVDYEPCTVTVDKKPTCRNKSLNTGKAGWRLVKAPSGSRLKLGRARGVKPYSAWTAKRNGVSWIGDPSIRAAVGTYVYKRRFSIPKGCHLDPTKSQFALRVDNIATVELDGKNVSCTPRFNQQPPGSCARGNFAAGTRKARSKRLQRLGPGKHVLTVKVRNVKRTCPSTETPCRLTSPMGLWLQGNLVVKPK